MKDYTSSKLKLLSLFLMIMVVVAHSYNLFHLGYNELPKGYSRFVQDFISHGIARSTVPLFFIISGYLFFFNFSGSPDEYIVKYKKRFSGLFIPYIFWSCLGLAVFFILQILPSRAYFSNDPIVEYSIGRFLEKIILNPIPYQFWFVRDLMLLIVLSPIINYLVKHLKLWPVVIFFILWFTDLELFVFSGDGDGLFFFSTGALIAIHYKQFVNISFSKPGPALLIIWVVLMVCKVLAGINLPDQKLLLLVLHKLNIMAGVIAIWSFYDSLFIKKDLSKSYFSYLATFSFFIYAFHEPFLKILKKIMVVLLGNSEFMSLIMYFIAPAIIIVSSVLIASFLRKYTPAFYSLITGGR